MRERLSAQAQLENALTTMLLVAAVVFLLMSLPLFLVIVGGVPGISGHFTTLTEKTRHFLFRSVAKQLEVFSHSLNFFVYFLSARRFRLALRRLCGCGGRRGAGRSEMLEVQTTNFSVTDM